MPTTDSFLVSETSHKIATITLNRPAARNSLSLDLVTALNDKIVKLGQSNDVHVIILAATGSAFCAGHDLKELTAARANQDRGRAFFADTMGRCSTLMQSIVCCPKPVIASVQGIATAAGCQLVASCDLAVCSKQAQFATPGVNIGLFCSTPMVALSRNIARKQAMELLLMGEVLAADQALQWGLVNKVVEAEQLATATHAMAEVIASKSPATVAIGKEAFYHQLEKSLSDAYDYSSAVMVSNMLEQDAEEGISAFLEKRPATWQDLNNKA